MCIRETKLSKADAVGGGGKEEEMVALANFVSLLRFSVTNECLFVCVRVCADAGLNEQKT